MRNSTVSLSKNTCFVVWRWVFPMFSNTKFAHYTCWNHPDTRACAVKTMGHISAGVGLLVISLCCGFMELESESDSSDGNNTDNEQQKAQNQRYQTKVKKKNMNKCFVVVGFQTQI